MKRQSIRVMLASEYPETRSLLRGIIESENKAVIVGQAENAAKALTLARNLRPDVAVIDSYLPHTVGLDMVPLSRIGGLDTAQTISADIPNIRVVLLNSLEKEMVPQGKRGVAFCRETMQTCIPFTLDELQMNKVVPAGALVFAHVVAKAKAAPDRKIISYLSDKAVFFGGLGILGGVILIITIFLSGAGIYLALAGVATLLVGLVGKLVSRILK